MGALLASLVFGSLPAGAILAGPNLLNNPGFEAGTWPGCPQVGAAWDPVQDGCQPTVQALVTDQKHSGAWAQRLGPSSQTDLGWLRQVSNYGSVQAGKTYEISAWIKSTVTDEWGWNVFRAEAFNNDSALWHVNMPQQESPNYDWRLIRWQYTVPAGFGINRIGVTLTRHWQNGSVWYDDVFLGEVNTGDPKINLSSARFARTVIGTASLPNDTFTVQNVGGSTLAYSINDDVSWLSVNPTNGDSVGEADAISVMYNTASLSLRSHQATITVSDPAATNSPQTINVTVDIRVPGDHDGDLDVDLDDFGPFQRCFSGNGVPQNDPSCDWAKLDPDPDVDADDLDTFQQCLTGAAVIGTRDCAD